jgi:hypothetical protein
MIHPDRRGSNPHNRMLSRRYSRIRPTPAAHGTTAFYANLNSRASTTSRKADLIALGSWAVITGRRWLVRAVHAAIEREGLRDK